MTQRPTALGIRLSPKNPDKKFYPKWIVPGQSNDYVAVTADIPEGTLGLYVRDGEAQHCSNNTIVPCVILLVGEHRFYIPKQCVRLVSDKEIEKALNDDEQKPTT